MRVISKKTLVDYYKKHPIAREALLTWHARMEEIEYKDFNHLKKYFPSVDLAGNNHYVFNIKGNTYRLVVVIQFTAQRALIRFIGTHAEYDKIKDISKI